MKTLSTVIIIAVLVIAGVLVYQNKKHASMDRDDMVTQTEVNSYGTTEPETVGAVDVSTPVGTTTGTVTAGEVKKFTVTGKNFSFSPNSLTVNKGDKVEITFINSEGMHDFRIEGYQVGTKIIKTGEKEVLTFNADKAGTFDFYCSVGQHRQMGMAGKFIVK